MDLQEAGKVDVSTHSPARGLTKQDSITLLFIQVSTHSPARGLTKKFYTKAIKQNVSTHSPARGLTGQSAAAGQTNLFQLTAPQGG